MKLKYISVYWSDLTSKMAEPFFDDRSFISKGVFKGKLDKKNYGAYLQISEKHFLNFCDIKFFTLYSLESNTGWS